MNQAFVSDEWYRRRTEQRPIDELNCRRRVFEAPSHQSSSRYIIKRTVPLANLDKFGIGRKDPRDADMLLNEVRAIEYVRKHTTIPVPTIITSFRDRDSIYMVQEYVEGAINAGGTRLNPEAHAKICAQLKGYVDQLHALTDPHFRSFVGASFLPARLLQSRLPLEEADYPPASPDQQYVLCHGDLGWQNILIDPQTCDIRCIIDWEYAGFYPVELEGDWTRQCPSVALAEPASDVQQVVSLLYNLSARMGKPLAETAIGLRFEEDRDGDDEKP
jgi:serine/threonine protein kinase